MAQVHPVQELQSHQSQDKWSDQPRMKKTCYVLVYPATTHNHEMLMVQHSTHLIKNQAKIDESLLKRVGLGVIIINRFIK